MSNKRLTGSQAPLNNVLPGKQTVSQSPQGRGERVRASFLKGDWQGARAGCVDILRNQPGNADALEILSLIELREGHVVAAVDLMRRAIQAAPHNAILFISLAGILIRAGRWQEAAEAAESAVARNVRHPEAYFNRALVGVALGKFESALADYRTTLELKPDHANAWLNKANLLRDIGRTRDALLAYDRAIELNPSFVAAVNNRGLLKKKLKRHEEAIGDFDRAADLNRQSPDPLYNKGHALLEILQPQAAAAAFQEALRRAPGHVFSRWALAFVGISSVPGTWSEALEARSGFDRSIDELDRWLEKRAETATQPERAIGSLQPFYLAYQEIDSRALLEKHGRLCRHWMQKAWTDSEPESAGAGGWIAGKRRIRLALVGEHFHAHSVWRALVQGWLNRLNRDRFEVFLFHTGTVQDSTTRLARNLADGYVAGRGDARGWIESIRKVAPDVILYPELGMAPVPFQLANLRLAPVQAVSWGHPVTSGLVTIDDFISADFFEPIQAQDHYTESLVRLPRLGCSMAPPEAVFTDSSDLDSLVRGPRPWLICPGTTYKYSPAHDHLLVEMARRLGRCTFVFFSQRRAFEEALGRRLCSAFAAAGLNWLDYVVTVPWLPEADYRRLLRVADVFLDTVGFSGFNTASLAADAGLPIVTREGRFMRGRLGAGVLHAMALSEWVASTDSGYVDLAVRLVEEPGLASRYRTLLRSRVERIYDDHETVGALERHLEVRLSALRS